MSKKSTLPDDAIARMAAVLGSIPKTRKERDAEINARYYQRNQRVWHFHNNVVRKVRRVRTQYLAAYNAATGQQGSVAASRDDVLVAVMSDSPEQGKRVLDAHDKTLAALRGVKQMMDEIDEVPAFCRELYAKYGWSYPDG